MAKHTHKVSVLHLKAHGHCWKTDLGLIQAQLWEQFAHKTPEV